MFDNIKPGGEVIRVLGGYVFAKLHVTLVTSTLILCGPWTFDRATGAEIDELLNWGPPPKATGSYIRLP
jgi:hypothetical protein